MRSAATFYGKTGNIAVLPSIACITLVPGVPCFAVAILCTFYSGRCSILRTVRRLGRFMRWIQRIATSRRSLLILPSSATGLLRRAW